jgi:FdhD protein
MEMPDERVEAIRRALSLHDVGKIGIPDSVLLKPRRFNDHERASMQRHCRIGADLFSSGHWESLQSGLHRREIKEQSGSHFDLAVVEAFLILPQHELFGKYGRNSGVHLLADTLLMNQPTDNEDAIAPCHIARLRGGVWTESEDEVIVEEPLEIRIGARRFSATMRTPQGEDIDLDLARGLLFSEGVIEALDDIASLKLCDVGESADEQNIVTAQLRRSRVAAHLWERNIISNSSCGLCGKASLEALRQKLAPLPQAESQISDEMLLRLPDVMRSEQPLFARTGGLHAAALFHADGALLACREDIGRHNAVDKVLGWALRENIIPARELFVLLCSGRASFEIVQKALVARIAVIASVSAASSLAVELATAHNATLVGFLRPRGFSVYTGAHRIEQSTVDFDPTSEGK